MNTVLKAAVLSIASLASILPAMTPAHADDLRYRRYYGRDYNRHYDRHNGGDALALGALGLATGVIVGGAIANSQPRYQERVYIDPPVDYYEPEPVPVYRTRPRPVVVQSYGQLRPWSPAWYDYCSRRYRSFDPQSGTFRGYDGRDYFCNAG